MSTVLQHLLQAAAKADGQRIVTDRQREIIQVASLNLRRSLADARRRVEEFYGISRVESRRLVGLAMVEILLSDSGGLTR